MKFKKVIFILMPFVLTAVIIGYTPKKTESAAYNVKKDNYDINEYLKKNHAEINLKNGSTFSLMDEDINKRDVILIGKSGAADQEYQLKFSLLKYLNKNHNVRYLMEEMGYSESGLINEYLKSGNEAYLKQVYEIKSGPVLCTGMENDYTQDKNYDFWIQLRKYNNTLPESKKIRVIGIGAENRVGAALEYLNSLLPENEPDEVIKPFIKNLKNISRQKNNDEIFRTIQKLKSSIEADSDLYKKYLDSRYFDFRFIIDNIINVNKIYKASGNSMIMETEICMFNNFKAVYSEFDEGKYFGELNMEHLYNKDVTVFTAYLGSSDSPVQDKVLSISYASEISSSPVAGENLDNLKESSKSDIALFKLNGDNSPFSSKSIFFKNINNKCDTDYFKYIIFAKD